MCDTHNFSDSDINWSKVTSVVLVGGRLVDNCVPVPLLAHLVRDHRDEDDEDGPELGVQEISGQKKLIMPTIYLDGQAKDAGLSTNSMHYIP